MTIAEEIRKDRESGARRLESEYKAGLLTLARQFCSDEGDAEELVNRTFSAVIEGIDEYVEQSAFFGWMCRILSNIRAKDLRRKSNEVEIADSDSVFSAVDPDAALRLYQDVDAGLLRDEIEALPSEMKETIILHYILGQPLAKVAKVLALPIGTVKSRLHYGRMALAAKLGAAAKKPGVKALLIALALAALTAAGAASSLAVAHLLSPAPAVREQQEYNGKDTDAQEQQAHNSTTSDAQDAASSGGFDETANANTFGNVIDVFPLVFTTPPPTIPDPTMKNLISFPTASFAVMLPIATMAGLFSDNTLVLVDDAMPSGYFSNVATGEQALALTGVRSGNQYFSRPDDRPAVWLASWSGGMCEAVTNANSHYINGLGTCANITDSSPSYALSDFTF